MLFSATKKQKINLKLKDTFEPNLGQIAKKGPFASSFVLALRIHVPDVQFMFKL